jgi:hypothetical protein
MKTVLYISSGDLSINADMRVKDSVIDLRTIREIDLEDNGKEFILSLKSQIFQDIEIARYKNKYQLAKALSDITIILNHARINYTYTKEFVTWLKTSKSY